MVQKTKKPAANPDAVAPKRRGRPRAYQPEIALGKALDLFRKDGFAATSLDDLSAATGMNRPSLYGAFGDKRELYLKSYARYRADARAAMIDIFRHELPIRERLGRIYAVALDIYLSGDPPVLALLASAPIHTIAVRARARVPRKELEAIVAGAIDVMVGAATK